MNLQTERIDNHINIGYEQLTLEEAVKLRDGLNECLMDCDNNKVEWKIPHPGTLKPIIIDSFEEGMDKYFEGFNLPVKITGGVKEAHQESYRRVSDFINNKNKRYNDIIKNDDE